MYLVVKFLVSAAIVVAISEVGRFSPRLGGLIASLPIVSILGMLWLYADTHDAQAVAVLSREIFWLVLPSLVLFLSLPALLARGFGFPAALSAAILIMLAAYGTALLLLTHFGIPGSGAP